MHSYPRFCTWVTSSSTSGGGLVELMGVEPTPFCLQNSCTSIRASAPYIFVGPLGNDPNPSHYECAARTICAKGQWDQNQNRTGVPGFADLRPSQHWQSDRERNIGFEPLPLIGSQVLCQVKLYLANIIDPDGTRTRTNLSESEVTYSNLSTGP